MDGKDTFQFQNGNYGQDAKEMAEDQLSCTKRVLLNILLFYVFSQLSKEKVIKFPKSERCLRCLLDYLSAYRTEVTSPLTHTYLCIYWLLCACTLFF